MIKHTQECEAGLVYRSYCIDTTTVYALYLLTFPACHQKWTTTTYPKPKSLPQTPPQEHVTTSTYRRPRHLLSYRVFFWTPWAPRRLGTNVCDVVFRQVQRCHRFVHQEGRSDGLRLRTPAGQAFDRGVMGCTWSCGWVIESHHWIG